MKSRVTTAHIAEHLGLGASTVAHVLSGRAAQSRIREETQQRVLEAARELGYRPNLSARAMRTGRFGSVALIQPPYSIYLTAGLVLGITHKLHEHDFHLCISEAPGSAQEAVEELPKVVRELAADGLLINMIADIPDSFIETVRSLDTPAIWMNSKQASDCVHPDDLKAGQIATEHLLQLGHRDIVHVGTGAASRPRQHYSVPDRLEGYEAAMRSAGLQPEAFYLPEVPHAWDAIADDGRVESAREFLEARRPTGVVAYSMSVALPLLHAAHQMGWRAPQDLSIVVFNENPDSQNGIALTTVCVPMHSVGSVAAEMLVEKVSHPRESLAPRTTSPYLFPGRTCAAPRST